MIDTITPELREHFREKIDFYAEKHPALLVRQLATLLKESMKYEDQTSSTNSPIALVNTA